VETGAEDRGLYCRLRPPSPAQIGEGAKIGTNFGRGERKNAQRLGKGAKANHLT